jgi:biotin operon repressor
MLDRIRKQNAEWALPIIQQGPIHLDDLAKQLYTSKIAAGYAVDQLRVRGVEVECRDDVVSIES